MLAITLAYNGVFGQTTGTIEGKVLDYNQEPLADYPVSINGEPIAKTNKYGWYQIELAAGKTYEISINYFDAAVKTKRVRNLKAGQTVNVSFDMSTIELQIVDVAPKEKPKPPPQIVEVDPQDLERIPVVQFEDALTKLFLGVRRRSELSTTYNVRGGNFDENLIYVNDIEVYRPFLARSGQQEGLGFVNPYMTEAISFSSGGFAARYGDKLSSVLDVTYSDPDSFSGSAELSLLGASLSLQDQTDFAGRKNNLTYNIGFRYRTLQYLLGSLDVSGDYRPRFLDFQSMVTYKLSSAWSVNWFSTIAQNNYRVEPESRETNFGTVQQAIRLFVGFAGAEQIQYNTFLNAGTLAYQPNDSTLLKYIVSRYTSRELEEFTIEGGYRLEELDNNLGSDNFAEAKALLGFGYFINNARNRLAIDVTNHKLMARIKRGRHNWDVGAKYQTEIISDYLKEWNYNDSSGYRLNSTNHPPREIHLDDYVRASNDLTSFRAMGYIQDEINLSSKLAARLNLGVRAHYWSLNGQTLISPRAQFSIEPNKRFNSNLKKQLQAEFNSRAEQSNEADYLKDVRQKFDSLRKREIVLTAAFGAYGQPPFYRELRNAVGDLNRDLLAQESIHAVIGSDISFKAWNRPFRFINEVYYKHMTNLVPYTINNVKLRYDAVNSSDGYAYGFDARVNGEFISGLESWINFSMLSTRENIRYTDENGIDRETGFIKRPTDQRVNFSILFQDELPIDTTFKMQLNLVIGSKMPYYFNGPFRYNEVYTLPAYRRVDIGFSKEVKRFTKADDGRFESLWLSLEIFNILQVNNVASYVWVKDLNNNLYGVPSYLTGRRLNLKVIGRF